MDDYFNLGTHTMPITTPSAEAQLWFDRGLNWCYAFHHKEAQHCFEKALEFDPDCAMAYWGIAHANGPYYNVWWEELQEPLLTHVLTTTYQNSRKALSLADGVTPIERALIEAFTARFLKLEIDPEENFTLWDDAYANAMRQVYAQFPENDDVCALTAESLMNRTPWELWNLAEGAPAEGADTLEAQTILETAIQRGRDTGTKPHPALHHFYIHCMEMSPTPEKALPVADTLWHLVPDAGHLIHMPSHIYVLCGQYDKVIQSNVDAVTADDKYLAIDSSPGLFHIYHSHNIHFQVYGALFSGQYQEALRAALLVEERVTEEALRIDIEFLANFLESLYSAKAHVFVRFGKWEEIIAEPLPGDPTLYVMTTAIWHYAKGIAHAVLGEIDQAVIQQARFRAIWSEIPEERISYGNAAVDVLAIADAMLDGELEYRRQNYDVAFDHLRRSVYLYDNLRYAEPWAWMQPPRHALGALLLEQGHVEEAAAVYRADLGLDGVLQRPSQHPNNVWALHGYAECLEKMGETEALTEIQTALQKAQAVADIPITASCFCRKTDHCCD